MFDPRTNLRHKYEDITAIVTYQDISVAGNPIEETVFKNSTAELYGEGYDYIILVITDSDGQRHVFDNDEKYAWGLDIEESDSVIEKIKKFFTKD